MRYMILGAAGFIGINLVLRLHQKKDVELVLVDQKAEYFTPINRLGLTNIKKYIVDFSMQMEFDGMLQDIDVLYHLVSSSIPTNSNQQVPQELSANVIFTANLLEACVRQNVKKVVFISSGGTVYGKEADCPLHEETPTYPISSYGLQKITIEKLLYLYYHMYQLDYRVIRLSNPYGPYQRPNGQLGAVTTFTYRVLRNEPIVVYGDGSVVRDFIYIDDAVAAIVQIAESDTKHKTYNVGSGVGTSISELVDKIKSVLLSEDEVKYQAGRAVDVPINFLDVTRYEVEFGKLTSVSLEEGIRRTASFLENEYI